MVLYADKKELDRFIAYYGRFLEKIPAIKTQALYAAAKSVQGEVRKQILEQGVQDPFGRVRRWQQVYLGSKGGYAAVRPMAEHTQKTWKGKLATANGIKNPNLIYPGQVLTLPDKGALAGYAATPTPAAPGKSGASGKSAASTTSRPTPVPKAAVAAAERDLALAEARASIGLNVGKLAAGAVGALLSGRGKG